MTPTFNPVPVMVGVSPDGLHDVPFCVPQSTLDGNKDNSPASKLDDLCFLFVALRSPDAIFEGLGRHGMRTSVCYSVVPADGPDGYVFVAFAYENGAGMVVFDWAWRKEDPECLGHPLNWQSDFARRTWRRT